MVFFYRLPFLGILITDPPGAASSGSGPIVRCYRCHAVTEVDDAAAQHLDSMRLAVKTPPTPQGLCYAQMKIVVIFSKTYFPNISAVNS